MPLLFITISFYLLLYYHGVRYLFEVLIFRRNIYHPIVCKIVFISIMEIMVSWKWASFECARKFFCPHWDIFGVIRVCWQLTGNFISLIMVESAVSGDCGFLNDFKRFKWLGKWRTCQYLRKNIHTSLIQSSFHEKIKYWWISPAEKRQINQD